MRVTALRAALLLWLVAAPASAQPRLTLHLGPYDEIDWRARVARSFGESDREGDEGMLASEENAIASMVTLLSQVRISSAQTVAGRLETQSELSALLATRIRDVAARRRSSRSDGSLTVRLDLDFTTTLGPLVAPEFGGGKPLVALVCPTCGQRWPEKRAFPEGVATGAAEGPPITGIVLRAGTLRYQPALFPRLLDLQGRQVYGPAFARRDAALVDGLVAYLGDGDPLIEERVGKRPLTITPLGVRAGCDFVLADADVHRLHGSARGLRMLQECRVVVVSGGVDRAGSAP